MTENRQVAVAPASAPHSPGLLEVFGERHNIPIQRVTKVLMEVAFPAAKTEEQLIALLVIANNYNLDPFAHEIYAFESGGKVFPMPGRQGWNRILRRQPSYRGKVVIESEKRVKIGNANPAPEWMECTINFNDGHDPETVRVYLAEWFNSRNPNWNTRPTHMLRGQAIKQAAREAFGLTLYDEDDKRRILEGEDSAPAAPEPSTNAERARAALKKTEEPPEEPEAVSEAPVAADEVVIEDAVIVDEETGEVVGEVAQTEVQQMASEVIQKMTGKKAVEKAADAAVEGTDFTTLIKEAKQSLGAEEEPDFSKPKRPAPAKKKPGLSQDGLL